MKPKIDKQAATLESELEQALRNIRAYRKTDPGYRRAIKAFIDAEVAHAGNAKPIEALLRRRLRDFPKEANQD